MDAKEFVVQFVAKKQASLSGNDWQMVIATLEESADNCHRCESKGCRVCRMTRDIADKLKEQVGLRG